jgi:RNA polymerase sigma-70 factor (ECF subfamily)
VVDDGSVLKTSVSLLRRLHDAPADQAAWSEFVARYGPRLDEWCRRWGLQAADAQDVTQTVLLRLAVKLKQFEYDPARSFRGWLRTLTRHAWSDFVAERQKSAAQGGDDATGALQTIQARDDLEARLNDVFDLELLEAAADRVQGRVAEKTWEVFRQTAMLGRPPADVVAELGMSLAAVYKAKSSVQKMLQQELKQMEPPE